MYLFVSLFCISLSRIKLGAYTKLFTASVLISISLPDAHHQDYSRLIEDLRAHVSLGADARVVADVDLAGGLSVHNRQAEVSNHTSTIRLCAREGRDCYCVLVNIGLVLH